MSEKLSLYLVHLRPAEAYGPLDYGPLHKRIGELRPAMLAGSDAWYVVSGKTDGELKQELEPLLPAIPPEGRSKLAQTREVQNMRVETWTMIHDPDMERLFVIPVYRQWTGDGNPDMKALFDKIAGGH